MFTDNCIGINTVKAFTLFTFYTGAQCITGALLMVQYIIRNGISDYVSLNPLKGVQSMLPGWRYVVVTYFVDPAKGDWFGFNREYFGYFPLNYDTGEIKYPDNFDQTEHYWID